MFDVKEKSAIVTGSASGIGLATAKMLLEKGSKVIMADYNEEALKEQCNILRETFGDNVFCMVADISVSENAKNLVNFAVEKFGSIDILVNNAGVTGKLIKIYEETDNMENVKKTFDINVNGAAYCTKYASAKMIEQGNGGAIVNTSSLMGTLGNAGGTGYCGTKHAVLGMTKTWALELAPYNIRVNALCPAYTSTGMIRVDAMSEQALNFIMSKHPLSAALKRIAIPEEMAHAILFMIENTFYTGQYILVDGGYSIQ